MNKNHKIKKFNLRVYGLLVRDGKLLVSAEKYVGWDLRKFPGGGVEYGEGVKDALKREWKEELEAEIEIGELFYVTDYFLQSAYRDEDQIISFYYRVYTDEIVLKNKLEHEVFWLELNEEKYTEFSFPQEQMVYEMLREEYSSTFKPKE